MKMNILVLIFTSIAMIFVAVNTYGEDTLEYKLATINAGRHVSEDDLTIARFRSLLTQLSEKYVEDRQQIADMTVTAQKLLRDDGIEESLVNIMEGINKVFYSTVENQKYAEYASVYVTLRQKGQTHEEAIKGLQAFLQALGVY